MNLVVSAITIVDLTNKEAKRVPFQPGKNLLTSDQNHLGKSVVMKSIFYTLGAEVYYPTPIKKLRLLTYLDFMLDEKQYRVARFGNKFVLYCGDMFVGYYKSVASFEDKLSELFKLEINLVSKDADGTIVKCPPAYYYLPYYIDQENGWSPTSYSFDRMGQFDLPQRKNSYFFHFGVLDNSYVAISRRQKTNGKRIAVLTKENEKYSTVIDTLREGLDSTEMAFDSESLEKAIHQRKEKVKKLLADLGKVRTELVEAEDQRMQLEYEKAILAKYIKKKAPMDVISDDKLVECPRCGLVFDYTVPQRLKKEYLLASLYDDYVSVSEKYLELDRKVERLTKKFEAKQCLLAEFESSLEVDRESYNAYVKSKATGQLLRDYQNQITENLSEIEKLRKDNSGIGKQLDKYNKERSRVNAVYMDYLGGLFVGLDIPTDQIDEFSEPGAALSASGAYGPRCKIAQMLAFVETQQTSAPELITFPIVIDSPNVLEQDNEHLDSVIRTLFSWKKTNNQIIVASIQGKETATELGDVNIISLTNPKNHLLSTTEYATYEEEISEIFTRF